MLLCPFLTKKKTLKDKEIMLTTKSISKKISPRIEHRDLQLKPERICCIELGIKSSNREFVGSQNGRHTTKKLELSLSLYIIAERLGLR